MPWSTPSQRGVPLAESVEVTKSILRSAGGASGAVAAADDAGPWSSGTATAWAGGASRVGEELVQARRARTRNPIQERAATCMAASFRDYSCADDCLASLYPLDFPGVNAAAPTRVAGPIYRRAHHVVILWCPPHGPLAPRAHAGSSRESGAGRTGARRWRG